MLNDLYFQTPRWRKRNTPGSLVDTMAHDVMVLATNDKRFIFCHEEVFQLPILCQRRNMKEVNVFNIFMK